MSARETGRPWRWIGAAAGLTFGIVEYFATRVLGGTLEMGGDDVTAIVYGFFAVTYGAFGWALGRLAETRRRLQRDAETIAAQHARVLQYEKLASIGRLAAGVAHEVRNSLGVVGSSSDLLVESLEDATDEQRKAARFIKEEIDRLDGFVRALLDFSKPVQPDLKDVELAGLFERVRQLAGGNGSGFAVHTERAEGAVRADPDLLTQVLLALALNARESVAEGGRVRISAESTAGEVRIEVADDGPGVSAEHRARIFEPFYTTKTEGTGLGLPMAERIVRAHEGRLELVDSRGLGERGSGACFRLTLPAAT